MNSIEKKMYSILKNLKDKCGVVGVKAEFEAEGTRTEELLRLLEIARKADLKMALKIGGCEAVRDLIEAKQFGVDYIIAPMVETPYALQKFIEAKNRVYAVDELTDIDFLVNIETKTAYDHRVDFCDIGSKSKGIQGIVFGRVDYVGSKGFARDSVDSDDVTDDCKRVGESCKKNCLDLVVGGGISINSIDCLTRINDAHLTRFETRKIIFSSSSLSSKDLKEGLIEAVHFELLWLLNKQNFYSIITNEDNKRIEMLNTRWKLLTR